MRSGLSGVRRRLGSRPRPPSDLPRAFVDLLACLMRMCLRCTQTYAVRPLDQARLAFPRSAPAPRVALLAYSRGSRALCSARRNFPLFRELVGRGLPGWGTH